MSSFLKKKKTGSEDGQIPGGGSVINKAKEAVICR